MMRSGQDTNILHSRRLLIKRQRDAVWMYPWFTVLFSRHGYVGDKPVGVLSHCLRARNGGKRCYSEKHRKMREATMCTGSMTGRYPLLRKEARRRSESSRSIPLMTRRSTTTSKTAGRSLNPGRRRLWKSGRHSIRAKSRRRTGTCQWTV